MTESALLDRLCGCYGIATEYTDIWGKSHPVSTETQRALLADMGVSVESEAALEEALTDYERRAWECVLPPVQVVREAEVPLGIAILVPTVRAPEQLHWRLIEESGREHSGALRPVDLEVLESREVAGASFTRYRFPLPCRLPLGYHRFELKTPAAQMVLIVVPQACYQPPVLAGEGRVWGVTAQLYSLRSQRNWGIGDFTDLRRLVELSAGLGADILGLNPLHALFPHNPNHASPYSPSSRIFLNLLYLDVEAIAEFAECEAAQERVRSPEFQAQLRALRSGEWVDYSGVAAAKLPILELLYAHFRAHHKNAGTEREAAYQAYQAAQGQRLRRHALFETLQEYFHNQDPSIWGWPVWPQVYRNPNSEAVVAFARAHQERIEFYQYLQWQTDLELGATAQRSLELSLGVGIYQDLAISVDRGGAEAWANQQLYALNVQIGAPPDYFSPKGQNWGLPPLIPERLREAAYAPFIATLRANMHHAGALRLDHVMGLMRLFWIPSGREPTEGTYVYYPFEDLLGILALESVRNRCLVIAEDLGTVPNEVREALLPLSILSYRLLYFEKTEEGSFKPPHEYPRQALVAITTHDLPTLSGYWQGTDLDRRAELGLFPSEEIREQQIAARAQDRAWLLMALEREGLLPAGASGHPLSVPEMSPELTRAVHLYLARTPAQVMVVQPEDIFSEIEQANLPGTVEQHPNWRHKLSLDLEDWASEPRLQAMASALSEIRGRPQQPKAAPPSQGPRSISLRLPIATYRLQLNRDFTFAQATSLIPYLHTLGISHCYASPYLKARPGSSHGYDIIDHNALNPEIGTPEEFDRFNEALHRHGMGQILDMVPNHMGVMGADNAWWLDVLENGPAAVHARFFDIDWQPINEALRGKVLLPVLGDHYGVVLEGGELQLVFDATSGAFSIYYYAHRFPVDPGTYPRILGHRLEQLEARMGVEDPQLLEYQSLITAFRHLPPRMLRTPEQLTERSRDKEIHKQHLAELHRRSPDIAWFIDENVRELNGKPGEPGSLGALHELCEAQAYRLAHWRVASGEINYRRFFDINDLAALRMEGEGIFEATHGLVLELLGSGRLDGLRIDHPDGLYDPVQYFRRIQAHFSVADPQASPGRRLPVYLIVEKILAGYEHLPEDWPVQGTTGYEFANLINGLFVDPAAKDALDQSYAAFIGEQTNFDELLYACKKLIMKVTLASELNVLANQLSRLAQADWRTRDFTLNSLRTALAEVVACFPVYRTYITGEQISTEDRRYIDWAISVAKRRSQAADTSIFDFIRDVLLTQAAEGKPQAYREAVVAFAMKFQQYTAPVMAKGLEDTSFYRYHRLVSLNEVGGDPRRFATSVGAFHRANQERARRWPQAMLCTSTHDSKRSEDVRARINVLSELPEEWQAQVARWQVLNRSKKRLIDDTPAPTKNDEYLLYQTLIGTWPFGELDEAGYKTYCERIERYMLKAAREAKVHSSWINPNPAYEEALLSFTRNLFESPGTNAFVANFRPFQARIARVGMYNSLAQILLKFMAPGVPDVYQGNELWDLSLVDPDNRHPVDYGHRQALLRGLQELDALPPEERVERARSLLDSPQDGRIKLYVTWKALALRQAHPELFREGEYQALSATGPKADHVCAFARYYQGLEVIVVAPRLFVQLLDEDGNELLGSAVWHDTSVALPVGEPRPFHNVFTGEIIHPKVDERALSLPLAAMFAHFPLALLTAIPTK